MPAGHGDNPKPSRAWNSFCKKSRAVFFAESPFFITCNQHPYHLFSGFEEKSCKNPLRNDRYAKMRYSVTVDSEAEYRNIKE